jgi:cytochrome c oxidase cbb3-type subunit I/II
VAKVEMQKQATEIVAQLSEAGIEADSKSKLIALIAYLQRMGTDIKSANE